LFHILKECDVTKNEISFEEFNGGEGGVETDEKKSKGER